MVGWMVGHYSYTFFYSRGSNSFFSCLGNETSTCVTYYDSYLNKYRVDDPSSKMGGEPDRLAQDEVETGPPPLQVQEPHRDEGGQEAPGEPVLCSSPHAHLNSK